MIQRSPTLVEQLAAFPSKAEIIDGRIVPMGPASFGHGRTAARIFLSLEEHEQQFGGGFAIPDNIGFLVDLPGRESFSPDAGWLAGDTEPEFTRFVDGPPTFAVEVRSPDDYGPAKEQAILQKIADYFAAGTLVVWDVLMRSGPEIRCYRASDPANPALFRVGDIADAEPAVSGWRFEVDLLS